MTRLHDLFEIGGQSPWIDNLRREWLGDGHLGELVRQGVRGVTSNPTIFQRAITSSTLYDADLARYAPTLGAEGAYLEMSIADVQGACDILHHVFVDSSGLDGYVSLEVAPALAHDAAGTVVAARHLVERVNRPNLMVKVPATRAGLVAVRALASEGISVNVTLIFGIARYGEVLDAWREGMQAWCEAGGDPAKPASVASFFVSRVDTEVDRRLGPAKPELHGRAAVAQAQLAYQHFAEQMATEQWVLLRGLGVRPQRVLWASTSTKNPTFPDLLYVEPIIGPNTVNTLPDATLEALIDHGNIARTVDANVQAARDTVGLLRENGISLDEVADVLEDEGIAAFLKSHDELVSALNQKATSL
jgi:transaldolase